MSKSSLFGNNKVSGWITIQYCQLSIGLAAKSRTTEQSLFCQGIYVVGLVLIQHTLNELYGECNVTLLPNT